MKTKNRMRAISEDVAEIPPKPKTPAIKEKIKKISDHLNITKSF